MTSSATTRELQLEVAHNVRHLGGYITQGGRATSTATIRSAGLHRLTPTGIGTLRDAGVEVVVDLRSRAERERDVTPALAPFGIRRIDAAVFEEDTPPEGLGDQFNGFVPVYRSMLELGRRAYRTLFETIASAQGRVLFHCAAGKDRTGLASAILLEIAGVGDETIVADYARSAGLLRPLFDAWLPQMRERGVDEIRARALLASDPEVMRSTLEHLRQHYGGAEGYLSEIGLSSGTLSALRARLIA